MPNFSEHLRVDWHGFLDSAELLLCREAFPECFHDGEPDFPRLWETTLKMAVKVRHDRTLGRSTPKRKFREAVATFMEKAHRQYGWARAMPECRSAFEIPDEELVPLFILMAEYKHPYTNPYENA